jgi:hypothetical protein
VTVVEAATARPATGVRERVTDPPDAVTFCPGAPGFAGGTIALGLRRSSGPADTR